MNGEISVMGKTQQFHELICKRERLKKKLENPVTMIDKVVTIKKIADTNLLIEKIRVELS